MFVFIGMFFSITAHAQSISLNFNTLPSTQGWTYSAVQGTYGNFLPSPVTESSVFSVQHGILTQNTIGQGLLGASYSVKNFADFSLPYTINVTARLLATENGDNYGFEFGTHENTYVTAIDFHNGYVSDGYSSTKAYIDTTVFHNYEMDVSTDGSYKLFIDGNFAFSASGINSPYIIPDNLKQIIYFGDATPDGSNAYGQISSYTFSQVSPPYALTVSNANVTFGTVSSNVGGIACGSICSTSFASGTLVTLTAIPVSGNEFIGWGGACRGYGNSCTVTMNVAQTVTANFAVFKIHQPVWKRVIGLREFAIMNPPKLK